MWTKGGQRGHSFLSTEVEKQNKVFEIFRKKRGQKGVSPLSTLGEGDYNASNF